MEAGVTDFAPASFEWMCRLYFFVFDFYFSFFIRVFFFFFITQAYKKNIFKSYRIILIFIQVGIDHNDDKTLPHNITISSRLELETSD